MQGYELIASNSLLHNLADPDVLWQTVASCARPGADILVMDLTRPDSTTAVDALVDPVVSSAGSAAPPLPPASSADCMAAVWHKACVASTTAVFG